MDLVSFGLAVEVLRRVQARRLMEASITVRVGVNADKHQWSAWSRDLERRAEPPRRLPVASQPTSSEPKDHKVRAMRDALIRSRSSR